MSIILKSGDSSDLAHVTPDNALSVVMSQDPAKGAATLAFDGQGRAIIATEDGSARMSIDALQMYEQVDGSALNTNIWTTSVTTMTVAQASGFITLNAAASTAANGYAILQSIRSFPLYGPQPLTASFNVKVTTQPQTNAVMELGIGTVSATSAPTDGCFFRWTATGELRAVINYGGVELQSAAITPPASNDMVLYSITVVEDQVLFLMDDIEVAAVPVEAGQPYPVSAGRQLVLARVYNGAGSPSSAPQMLIGQIVVVQQALQQTKPFGQVLAQMGRGSYQAPVSAFGQTANHTNSTNPTSATLSNTAAGYASLGGRWQFAALAGAVTDFALFAYQVPAGYQLVVGEIVITAVNTGAAGSLTVPTVMDWSLGLNASAVSLATADATNVWAPRRLPLGTQAFPTTTLLGAVASEVRRTFNPPLVIDGGRYFHVILQVPVGAATSSQVIRGDVMISGYFE